MMHELTDRDILIQKEQTEKRKVKEELADMYHALQTEKNNLASMTRLKCNLEEELSMEKGKVVTLHKVGSHNEKRKLHPTKLRFLGFSIDVKRNGEQQTNGRFREATLASQNVSLVCCSPIVRLNLFEFFAWIFHLGENFLEFSIEIKSNVELQTNGKFCEAKVVAYR